MLPSEARTRRAAIEHALATDPTLRASVAAALDVLAQTAQGLSAPPLPPEPTPPPPPPRGRRRAKGEEPLRENYKNDHSFNQARSAWKKELGEAGSAAPTAVTRRSLSPARVTLTAVTNDSRAVTNDITNDCNASHSAVTNDHEPSHSGVIRDSFVIGVARASEPSALCISEEKHSNTVVVSELRTPETHGREVTNDRRPAVTNDCPPSDRPSDSVRDRSRMTRSPEAGDDDAHSKSLPRSLQTMLRARSAGRITVVLTPEREELFAAFVERALVHGFERADFEALADLVGRGRAKWWRSSWSLSLLLSNDCHGLLLGLENARRWRLTEAKKGTAPQHAAPARGLSTPGDLGAQWLEELASKGLLKRAAGGT